MSDQVIFRPRSRGCAVPRFNYGGVSFLEPKLEIVRGWETGGADPADGSFEVGPGTEFPIEVTTAQLFEIMYRIRDSKISSAGSVEVDFSFLQSGGTWSGACSLSFAAGAPPTKLAEEDNAVNYTDIDSNSQTGSLGSRRSALCLAETPFSGLTDYDTDRGARFGEIYHIDVAGVGDQVREPILELGMWYPSNDGFSFQHYWDFLNGGDFLPSGLNQALYSFYDMSATDEGAGEYAFGINGNFDNDYGIGDPLNDSDSYYGGGDASLSVLPVVAFIDVTGSGDPYDPLNRRFICLNYSHSGAVAYQRSGTSDLFGLHSTDGVYTDMEATSSTLTIELQSGDISCPLYFFQIGTSNLNYVSSGDVVVTPTKWWAYQKPEGGPVWDENTGERI